MLCPYCSHPETKVTDKRDVGRISRRRRECLKCENRFSTHEIIELNELKIIKKNGLKEAFDREKIRNGIKKACEKRPVSEEKIDKMVTSIESRLRMKGIVFKSDFVGNLISKELKKIDNVAYIRFASVYRDFADLGDFKKEIKDLQKK
jgi:transcriptional repressor NrdR